MNTQTRAELTTYRYPNDDNPLRARIYLYCDEMSHSKSNIKNWRVKQSMRSIINILTVHRLVEFMLYVQEITFCFKILKLCSIINQYDGYK
ncbi:MAG: hypothetical protein ACJ71A_10075, partial [Nitrososphaeraceae archaeon]